MVPFDSMVSRQSAEAVEVRETAYPREVMEAGWVPEVAGLGERGDCDGDRERPGQPAAPEALRNRLF